jgi:hypothetical protein
MAKVYLQRLESARLGATLLGESQLGKSQWIPGLRELSITLLEICSLKTVAKVLFWLPLVVVDRVARVELSELQPMQSGSDAFRQIYLEQNVLQPRKVHPWCYFGNQESTISTQGVQQLHQGFSSSTPGAVYSFKKWFVQLPLQQESGA